MSYRVILAPLFGSDDDDSALQAAFRVAKRFDGHVVVLYPQPDPRDVIPRFGEAVSADAIKRLMDSAAAAVEQQRASARKSFEKVCAAMAINLAERPGETAGPSAIWIEPTARQEVVVPARALLSDLVVLARAQSEIAPALRPAFDATLLGARCPILLAPPQFPDTIGHTIAIAWNGSTEAASALNHALLFLESATSVHGERPTASVADRRAAALT